MHLDYGGPTGLQIILDLQLSGGPFSSSISETLTVIDDDVIDPIDLHLFEYTDPMLDGGVRRAIFPYGRVNKLEASE